MSVLDASAAPLRVEAPAAEHAASLVQALVRVVPAEDIALDAERLEVHVQTLRDSSDGQTLSRVFGVVKAWLERDGLDATVIHLEGRSYRVDAREGASRE